MKGILELCLFVLFYCTQQIKCQQQQQHQRRSPCPSVFTYDAQTGDSDDTWLGTLKLQSSVQLFGITVDVIFDRPVKEFSAHHYSEASITNDNTEFRVENKNFQLDPGHTLIMNIIVRYYRNNIIPLVKQIRLNGQNVCIDTPSITLQPVYRPPQDNSNIGNSQYDYDATSRKTTRRENPTNFETTKRTTSLPSSWIDNSNFNHNVPSIFNHNNNPSRDTPTITTPPPPFNQERTTTNRNNNFYYASRDTTTTERHFDSHFPGDLPFLNRESTPHSILSVDDSSDDACGTVIPKTNPLIVHGLDTSPGNFPWHAAIYFSDVGNLKYICGGSLIAMNSVLTAAHCVTHQKTTRPISADKLLVYLGKHNLQKWTGQEQDGKIIEIVIHDEFDPERFYSDIAILKLKDSLVKTNYVRTVCLWKFDSDIRGIIDKLGSVPGWGYNENGLVSDDLTFIKMPVVTHETCIWSNRDFFSKITSDKSFCAGFRNGTNVCNGDSGGGIVFKQANKWFIRGVVSVSIALQNSVKCDPDHYAVFVDIAKFTTWIDRNI